jgi:hypothetical protein
VIKLYKKFLKEQNVFIVMYKKHFKDKTSLINY